MAPAARTTSARAVACSTLPSRRNATPVQREPANSSLSACAPVSTVRLARPRAGRRNALAVVQRTPRRWVTWK